jgi:hypothetical protein
VSGAGGTGGAALEKMWSGRAHPVLAPLQG